MACLVSLALLVTGCASGPQSGPVESAPDPQLEQALSLLSAGEVHAALSALETWIAAHPDAPAQQRAWVHARAAHACALLEQPEEGLAHADAGIVLSPDDPWLHYARGVALHKIGQYSTALDAFSRALELDSRHVKSAQWRAYTYLLTGRTAEAVRDYDTALAILEVSDDAALRAWGSSRRDLTVATLRGRADALDALGRHDAAEADREAARHCPCPITGTPPTPRQ